MLPTAGRRSFAVEVSWASRSIPRRPSS